MNASSKGKTTRVKMPMPRVKLSNVERHNTVRSIRKQHASKLGRY